MQHQPATFEHSKINKTRQEEHSQKYYSSSGRGTTGKPIVGLHASIRQSQYISGSLRKSIVCGVTCHISNVPCGFAK
jgi:hypothetical protein